MNQLEQFGYFINQDGVKSTDLALTARLFKPNVEVPKKRINGYALYVKELFPKKKAKLGKETKTTEVLAALSHDWTELSSKKKAQYTKLALADQTRYDREMQELLTQGYFVREDGTRSQNKPIKTEVQTKIEGTTAKNDLVKKEETPKGKSAASVGSKRAKEHAEPKAASTKRLKK